MRHRPARVLMSLAASIGAAALAFGQTPARSAELDRLAVGVAQHAFDHLGAIGEQADAVAATGGNVVYATGCGGVGYDGLPPADKLAALLRDAAGYNERARAKGIKVVLGYVCATSIVKLDTFDKNWSPEFRARFKTPPAEWRQQDASGKPLPSWYGGQYNPACMNHPDWLEYEKFIVRQQLDAGHDGVFFDNPTVHPQGCYCPHCMAKFSAMLVAEKVIPAGVPVAEARLLAAKHPKHFLRFRGTTGRDFLHAIREYARGVKPGSLVTCNNSLNTPDALFKQAHTHAYNIFEMSKAEDLVVVEDMMTQPRVIPGQRALEYGPSYQQIQAVSRGLPVVANLLAQADNHTPPNLCRLAMAEAAAHGASYLSWPTWPEAQRERMAKTIRAQADLQLQHAKLLNDTQPRRDVILFLPFRRWTESQQCVPYEIACKLTAANVQYAMVAEDKVIEAVTPKADPGAAGIRTAPGQPVKQAFLVESRSVLEDAEKAALEQFEAAGGLVVAADEGDWMKTLQSSLRPSLEIRAEPSVRAVIRDQGDGRSIVHVYNLAVERLSSFEDKVHPATDVALRVRVPMANVKSVKALTADAGATADELPFTVDSTTGEAVVDVKLPKLKIATMLVIE